MRVEKIPGNGLFALLFMFLVGSAIILPRGAGAGHDNWISLLLALAAGFGLMLLFAHLYQKHPGLSLIEIAEGGLGSIAGKLVGVLYAWYALHLGSLVLRNVEELTLTVMLPRTPPLIIKATILFLVVWIAYAGIEVICRSAQAVCILVVILLVLSYVLQFSDMEIEYFLPLFDRGMSPVLEGALQIFSFPFGEAVLFLMVFPALRKAQDAKRYGRWAVLIAGFVLLADTMRNTLVFSELSSRLQFPSFLAFSYVSVADFLERMEPFAFVVWVLCGFFKISVCLYVCAGAVTRTIKSSEYRIYLIPLGLIMLWFSEINTNNQAEIFLFANDVWPYYSLPFQVMIPMLLLFVRKKKEE